jgi:hypothetical protein
MTAARLGAMSQENVGVVLKPLEVREGLVGARMVGV